MTAIESIVAHAGYSFSVPKNDYGIDGTIEEIIASQSGRLFTSGLRLDIQVKATYVHQIKDENIVYPLRAINYNDLVDTDAFTPRILLLYTMPRNKSEWLLEFKRGLVHKSTIYWCSLYGKELSNNANSVTIKIPCSQVFNASSLKMLMDKIKEGGELY